MEPVIDTDSPEKGPINAGGKPQMFFLIDKVGYQEYLKNCSDVPRVSDDILKYFDYYRERLGWNAHNHLIILNS